MAINNLSVPFRSGGSRRATVMPKLQNRFRIWFSFDGEEKLLNNIISVSSIVGSFETHIIDIYNSKIKYAGKHQWDSLTVVFRNDVDNDVVDTLYSQYSRQISMATQSAPLAGNAYKFFTRLENLDGDGVDPATLDEYILIGCHISSITSPDLNYQSSDYQQYQLSLEFDNVEHIVNGVKTLTTDGDGRSIIGGNSIVSGGDPTINL